MTLRTNKSTSFIAKQELFVILRVYAVLNQVM